MGSPRVLVPEGEKDEWRNALEASAQEADANKANEDVVKAYYEGFPDWL